MQDNEYTPLYYKTPCQVRYYETEDGQYYGGIALQDFIICGHCGTVMPIDDIVKCAVRAGVDYDDAIIELDWMDMSNTIIG